MQCVAKRLSESGQGPSAVFAALQGVRWVEVLLVLAGMAHVSSTPCRRPLAEMTVEQVPHNHMTLRHTILRHCVNLPCPRHACRARADATTVCVCWGWPWRWWQRSFFNARASKQLAVHSLARQQAIMPWHVQVSNNSTRGGLQAGLVTAIQVCARGCCSLAATLAPPV